MHEKNLDLTGNLLASYSFLLFLGIVLTIAMPFLFIYTLFQPGSLADFIDSLSA